MTVVGADHGFATAAPMSFSHATWDTVKTVGTKTHQDGRTYGRVLPIFPVVRRRHGDLPDDDHAAVVVPGDPARAGRSPRCSRRAP